MLVRFFGIGVSFYTYLGLQKLVVKLRKVRLDISLSVSFLSLSLQQILAEPLWTPCSRVVVVKIHLILKGQNSAVIKSMGFPK